MNASHRWIAVMSTNLTRDPQTRNRNADKDKILMTNTQIRHE